MDLEKLLEKISSYTGIEASNLDLDRPFMELGFDSVTVVQFIGEIERELNLKLDMTALIDYPTINKLNDYLNNINSHFIKSDNVESESSNTKVAIVGIACRFPGAESSREFYDNLCEKKVSVTSFPEERIKMCYTGKLNLRESIYDGGYIDAIDEFDNVYFNISPNEALKMDPQQRLLMQEIVHALEDANINKKDIDEKKIGLFVGATNADYFNSILPDKKDIESIIGNSMAMLSNRMSYMFNFKGPSVTLDTACSSSLVAVVEACNSIKNGYCDVAIAAGVNLILNPDINTALFEAGMLSKDGACHTFEDTANGYVRGEGVGVIVLKKQDEAEKSCNRIYASILGANVNQDGRSASVTAPNKLMQIELLNRACNSVKLSPSNIRYVETHGTGTLLGDYIEVSAINETLNSAPGRNHTLLLGAVKKNIGHLEGAAGIASLIKVALSLYNSNLAPTIRVGEYNPRLELKEKNIEIVEDNLQIADESFPCAISSFGFGGTNSCVIIDRYENKTVVNDEKRSAYIIPVSDVNGNALHRNNEALKRFIENSNASMSDLEYASTHRCSRGKYRDAFVVESLEDLVDKISNSQKKDYRKNVVGNRKKIGLLFSGQGSQWAQMANGLTKFEAYSEMFERCVKKFKEIGHCDVREVLADIEKGLLKDTYYAQPAIFTVEVSLAKLLERMGVEYDYVCGHSFGEISAAYICGAISLDAAVRIIYTRSDILRRFEGKGKMLSVNISLKDANSYIDLYDELSVGVINLDNSVVFSGSNKEIADIEHRLVEAGYKCKQLPVNCSFHFKGLEKYRNEFIERVGKVRTKPISKRFISTVVGEEYQSKKLDVNYWADNMCQTVRFDKASKILDSEADVVIEVAPASVLLFYLMHSKSNTSLIPLQKRNYNPTKALLEGTAQLYSEGIDIDWFGIASSKGNSLDLPNYEFARNKFWPNSKMIRQRHNLTEGYECNDEKDLETDFIEALDDSAVLGESDVISRLIELIKEEVCVNDEIMEDTDIYDLGLDSLKCFQLNACINKSFNSSLSFKDFSECKSIKELASMILVSIDTTSEESEELSEDEFCELVTPGQKAIILDQFLNPGSNKYNMGAAWKMDESINKKLWKSACEEVINRYLVLRLIFEIDKRKKIVQRKNKEAFVVNEIDCCSPEQASSCLNEAINGTFDLSKEVARCTIINERNNWYFGLVIHHAVIDGISIFKVFEEIILTYKKKVEGTSATVGVDKEYLKYQINENKIISGANYKSLCDELKNRLSSYSLVRDYPVKLREVELIPKGASEKYLTIEAKSLAEIKKICNENKYSVFELMYGLYQILYYKISNSNNFITCTYSSGREDTKYFNTVGYLVKNVLTGCHIDRTEKLNEYIKNLHSDIMDAFSYPAGVSLSVLEDKINEERVDLGHVFVYEKATGEVKGAPIFINGDSEESTVYVEGIGFEKITTPVIDSQYGIVFMMEECEDSLVLKCQYKNSVYSDEEVDVLMNSYYSLITNVISNPNGRIIDYELSTSLETDIDEEYESESEKINKEALLYHQYLERYAELTPDSIAATYENEQITYGDLNHLSNYLANKIVEITGGKEEPIGIAVEKSIRFLVSIFAVLKAGSFYVPLDKNYPKERLDYIISNSKMNLIISDGTFDSMNLDWNDVDKILYPKILFYEGTITIDGTSIDKLSIKNLNRDIDIKNGAYSIYTSGTTGVPKGVKVSHSGISDVVIEQKKLFKVTNTDKVSFFASVCFDASVFDILMAIGHGAELCFDKRENMGTGTRLHKFLKEQKITITTLPSSVLASMENKDLDLLRVIVTAGEPCTSEVKNTWCKGHDFFNAYGVTEATIWNTTSKCSVEKPVLIGKAVSGNKLLVVNSDNNICPKGCAGELLIGGRVVAIGYIGLDEENKKKFITINGERFYKSGDIVRQTKSGEFEYVGRVDNQIKIHGFRIEIEEIEKVLQNQPGIKNAIVVTNDTGSDKRLVCFIETQKGSYFDINSFKKKLIEILPHYMVPEQFIQVDSIELTNNGKIDRKKLEQHAKEVLSNRVIVEPSNELEREVLTILKKYVDVEISIEDTLIELGINSINIYNLIVDMEERYGVSLGIGELLSGISVKELASLLANDVNEENSIAKAKTFVDRKKLALLKRPQNIPIVLTDRQRGIWLACAINSKTQEFNIPVAVKLTGNLNYEELCTAFKKIVDKHEILRTRYMQCNETIIGFVKNADRVDIPLVDISDLGEKEKSEYITKEIKNMKCIDLHPNKYPLYKIELLKSSETEFYLLLTIHHFIADGWSFSIIFDELRNNYNALKNNEINSDVLEYQYSDVAYTEAVNYSTINNEETKKYWASKFNNENTVLNLPEDYQRPSVMTHIGRNTYGTIDGEKYNEISEYTKRNNVTKFSFMTAVLGIVLRKYSGQQSIPIGFPVLGREDKYSQKMVGMFIDTTVALLPVNDNDSFQNYLSRVNQEILESIDYGKVGLGRIMEIVNPTRTTDNTSLFQVMVNMVDFDLNLNDFDEVVVEPVIDSEQKAKYDFTFYIHDDGEKLNIRLNYYSDVYSESTAQRMLLHFSELISQIVSGATKSICEYRLDAAKELQLLNYHSNESLENLAQSNFKIICKNEILTSNYFLNKKNEIVHILENEGINSGENIGLSGYRKPDIIAAMLAVESVGCRFVIIDNEWPEQRKVDSLNAARCTYYLDISKAPKIEKISDRKLAIDVKDCGYISLTSGTTGKPKCILGHNSAINHFISWETEKFNLGNKDVFAVLSGISHDPFLRDIFVPLSVGGTIVFPTEELLIKNDLFDYLYENKISVANMTPSLADAIILQAQSHEDEILAELRWIFFGGERLKKSTIKALMKLAPNCRFVNYYGTTETPQGMSYIEYDDVLLNSCGEYLPIGQGISDVQVIVADNNHNETSIGEIGTILIRTKYLAKGYLCEEDGKVKSLTSDGVTYNTGDIGRYRGDGTIEILGRSDDQVKILGHRIELGEIESAILKFSGVHNTKAIVLNDKIYAFVIAHADFDEVECIYNLHQILPSYMIPAHVFKIDAMPLTQNGKTDIRELKKYINEFQDSKYEIVNGTETEKQVYKIWQDVLGYGNIPMDKTFFDVGGTSISLLVLQKKLELSFRRDISVTDLFEYSTIRSFSEFLETSTDVEEKSKGEWDKSRARSANAIKALKMTAKKKRETN
ncbi:amino acid adenylation domain-containing protein [Pseudobutyrivibrio sp. UC1225]|uniref:hybrid non-ribosomal peptide synthetase/type I polyketide synthase n=1 Tax=Pseudobutyrivibrio sp. UC1225 TaxID=1798185 RepID=UPI0008E4BEA6|nr:hybrid non-ribosomal peptide synthetase/type I polyketide synthase [Pseudobutyrivibrio sp. UC1225]SFO33588.1 amino acid adenylation domain-containing protein [Pseudobutyrivibrio sp. UC1225]